ncbi:lipopolysaccharide biosynthesis protein [Myroides odoratus]|uniref:lipopolysaccharide biosynthesis protein n=1 Tax=Myroides odoratus TaxID=256 RepID=UPI0033427977
MSSLRSKTVNGIIWNALQSFGTRFIQLAVTIVIARILLPSDFGLIGMLYVFIALGGVILDAGFGQALIRKENVDDLEYSSVFYFNIAISVLIYLLLYLLAPSISVFYSEPRLTDVSRAIFFIFPINAFALIQNTILSKRIDFKLLAKITITSAVVSGIVGVVMAYLEYGVWALVMQTIVQSLATVVLLWYYNKWRPIFAFSYAKIKGLLGFSLNLLGTNVLIVLFNNIYTLIIGKFYLLDQVGYYNQAKKFQDVPTSSITSIVQSVTYPVLSRLQNNDGQLREAYRKVINMAVFINFPIMLGLIACADNLFMLLLKEKWMPAVPYFQILCIYGALFPLHSINVNILKVKNKTKRLFVLEVVRRLIVVVAIVFTISKSIEWLIIGSVIASIFSILINMYYCGKEIELKVKTQLIDVIPIFVIAVISTFVMYMLKTVHHLDIVSLIIQIFAGTLSYLMLSKVFKVKSLNEIVLIVKEKIGK